MAGRGGAGGAVVRAPLHSWRIVPAAPRLGQGPASTRGAEVQRPRPQAGCPDAWGQAGELGPVVWGRCFLLGLSQACGRGVRDGTRATPGGRVGQPGGT